MTNSQAKVLISQNICHFLRFFPQFFFVCLKSSIFDNTSEKCSFLMFTLGLKCQNKFTYFVYFPHEKTLFAISVLKLFKC